MVLKRLAVPLLGLILVLLYWYHVHPLDFSRGYFEDWCSPDISRQLMAEAIDKTGGPSFHVDSYLAPYGMPGPFMAWEIEMSWLGSYFWKWNRDFPFMWAQFGLSLLISYLGTGWILRRMRLAPAAAWGLATAVVVFHVPRHYKTWHHAQHLFEHWVYLSFFLDAWIWQRLYRDRRWSWSLEAWRGLFLLGMLTTAGIFWGPLILEWALVRASMLVLTVLRRRRGESGPALDGRWRQAVPTVLLGLPLLAVVLRFYLPLAREVEAAPHLEAQLGWFGHWPYFVRPLWLDSLVQRVFELTGRRLVSNPIHTPETVITPGWIYWVACVCGLLAVGRAGSRRAAAWVALPFLALLAVALLYVTQDPPLVAVVAQKLVPFMKFFRVATRWGLFLPPLLIVVLALCWPELSAWARGLFPLRTRRARVWVALLAVSTAFELWAAVRAPIWTMPGLSAPMRQVLQEVKDSPGTTVLDLPFCLAGGNGVCTEESCPNYPRSTVGGCLRGWHDKKVYGAYVARLFPEQCALYHQAPYLSWFDAWKTQRCFSEPEWTEFCAYLDAHAELSTVLLYPDIWSGAGTSECLAQFEKHLGPPLGQAEFAGGPVWSGEPAQMSRLIRFESRCLRTSAGVESPGKIDLRSAWK